MTVSGHSLERCLIELFLEQAAASPEAPAVRAGDASVTYAQLAALAGGVAAAVRDGGVDREAIIALALPRGVSFVASLLGVLGAGAAFVPLDLRRESAAHVGILEQTRSPTILTTGEALDVVEQALARLSAPRPRIVLVDDAAPLPLHASGCCRPDDLAYVMFTSGSTGAPKGAMVEHRGMVNHMLAKLRDLEVTAEDVVAQLGPPCFDIVVWQCLAGLVEGAAVCVVSDEIASDPRLLLAEVAEQRVTILQLVPALMRGLVGAAELARPPLPDLRFLVPTGDALPTELCARWFDLYPHVPILNTYGSTECSDDQCHFRLDAVTPDLPATVPIGQPIENMSAHVLDQALRPVPAGVAGELYIGGVGVGRGYLGRPELTAAAFVASPFNGGAAGRLYRTGDRARVRADGALEFLGRIDGTVKIRGHRVELDETEAVLREQAAVADAVVVGWTNPHDATDVRLLAYVVLEDGAAATARDIRAVAAARLPAHMVPALVTLLERFPLTDSGKVDRNALPSPAADSDGAASDYLAPRNTAEEQIERIWCEVLGRPTVGVEDSFFELGGHSLLAAQLLAALERETGLRITLRQVFERPTVAGLAALLGEAATADGGRARTVLARPESRHDRLALTDLQEAYHVGERTHFELGNVRAHVYTEFEAEGLDLRRAEMALRRLIERHDVLRLVLDEEGRQRVLRRVPPYEVECADLTRLSEQEAEVELAATRARMRDAGSPTGRWPLFEVRCSLLAQGRVRVHISISLLLADAHSEHLLLADWLRLYAGEPVAPTAPTAAGYRDHVLALQDDAVPGLEEAWAYWRERIPTLPAAPELPLGRAPATVATPRFTRRTFRLEAGSWQRLRERCAARGLTPSAALCAAYAEVLRLWSTEPRFTLNVLSSLRPLLGAEAAGVAGNFGSTLPLEIEPQALTSFTERARALQERLLDGLEHGQVSGVAVAREAARQRGWGTKPVLPVVFASVLDVDTSFLRELPFAARVVAAAVQTPQVFLDHQVYEYEGALVAVWDVVEEVFPPGLVDRMWARYRELVGLLAEDEDAWERSRPLAVEAGIRPEPARFERALRCDERGLLHTPFFERAAVAPEAVAIRTHARAITYGELEAQAHAVAGALRRAGVAPGALVPVVMEKGWEQVAAVLGILTVGAAYVPVDAALPEARLRLLLDGLGTGVALTQARVDESLGWPQGATRLAVDGLDPTDAPVDLHAGSPDELAYVIYTSGSTGVPKGVAIEHRGALNTVAAINRRFALDARDRVLALSSLSFDLSVWDIFGTLAAGGTIVLPDAERTRGLAHWAELIEATGPTVWNSVPALLDLFLGHLEQVGAPTPRSLRLALLSGDWIPVTLPDRLRRAVPGVEMISLGGATEASIWSILYPIEAVDPEWRSIPYGRALPNQQVHVLDHELEPRPTWVPGELYIGGVGVAAGYWNDGERTRERFVVHPETGARIYRTGDLGRLLPDGNIEFLGRQDAQVKVQGHRIELGEVEATLLHHADIGEAAVAVSRGADGWGSLIAYVVPREGVTLETAAIREHAASQLPAYMVPSRYVVLSALPLTTNGKVDRAALPDPDATGERTIDRRVAPRDELEARLRALVEDVLETRGISVSDSFFDLGGTSFSAMRLLARIEGEFGRAVPMATLFESPTIAQLATRLREQPSVRRAGSLVPLRVGRGRPFIWIHPVGGGVLCYRPLAEALGGEYPLLGIEAAGLNGTEPDETIEALVQRYLAVVLDEQPAGPYRLGGWSMGGIVALELARSLVAEGADVESLVLVDSSLPELERPQRLGEHALLHRFLTDLLPERTEDEVRSRADALRCLAQGGHRLTASELERLLRVFEANSRALAAYEATPYEGNATVLAARDGEAFDRAGASLGWEPLIAHLETRTVPGTHHSIMRAPHVNEIAAIVEASLTAPELAGGRT